MNDLILIVAIFVLLCALRKISMIKYSGRLAVLREAKQNAISMFWGVIVISAFICIPYQVWVLTGSSHYWNGVYIIGGTSLLTIAISYHFNYKSTVKFNDRVV